MDKEAFFTRGAANRGIVVPLHDPRTGEKTEHWLRILGRDSDVFRAEEIKSRRRVTDAVKDLNPKNKREIDAKLMECEAEETLLLIASLVIAWSFDGECTRQAVVAFLREAPQIANAIDEVATKRVLFLANAPASSPDTQRPSSDSTSQSKEEPKPSANV
jgi:hypothetical protein